MAFVLFFIFFKDKDVLVSNYSQHPAAPLICQFFQGLTSFIQVSHSKGKKKKKKKDKKSAGAGTCLLTLNILGVDYTHRGYSQGLSKHCIRGGKHDPVSVLGRRSSRDGPIIKGHGNWPVLHSSVWFLLCAWRIPSSHYPVERNEVEIKKRSTKHGKDRRERERREAWLIVHRYIKFKKKRKKEKIKNKKRNKRNWKFAICFP